MKNAYALTLIFLLSTVGLAQTNKKISKEQLKSGVNFCDLINNFDRYKNKDVTVKAEISESADRLEFIRRHYLGLEP